MNASFEGSIVSIYDSVDDVAETVAKQWLELSQSESVKNIALSGGRTPKHIFGYIAHSDFATSIQWQKLHFWWGDERCVSANDEQSNYGEAMRLLFSHVLIPANNLHPIHGELTPEKAVIDYKDEMEACLNKSVSGDGKLPIFDWIILGIGEDGHTASLFPGDADLESAQSAVIATQPNSEQVRISLTAHTISAAKRVSFIATGSNKAAVVSEVIEQVEASKNYPAAHIFSRLVASARYVEWVLDADAATRLSAH